MISEETFVVNGGIINRQSRNAFFRAELTTLNAMSLKDGQEFPIEGKLVHHEATTPFYPDQAPKKAGKDGGVLLFNGMPIYRETVFTSDPAETDLLVKHTSVAAVAAKYIAVESIDLAGQKAYRSIRSQYVRYTGMRLQP